MSQSTHENILGYVLGCLEPSELEQFEQELHCNSELQSKVSAMQRRLAPLTTTTRCYDPPVGLAERTCDRIFSGGGTTGNLAAATARAINSDTIEVKSDSASYRLAPYRTSWSLRDFAALAGVLAIVGFILFPSLLQSRNMSMRLSCQNNLKEIGSSFLTYVDLNDGRYPELEASGNLNAAGVFPLRLIEDECLINPSLLICPASDLASEKREWRVPTIIELENASPAEAKELHRTMGGSLAYNMSFVREGLLVVQIYQGRPNYAIISDAPEDQQRTKSLNHGGYGQNVLFEDGHTGYITCCNISECDNDDIFHNRDGFVAAGLGPMDSVLGLSSDNPVTNVSLVE